MGFVAIVIAALFTIGAIGLAIVIVARRRRQGSGLSVSIAMLRSTPLALSQSDVRGAFRRAFGKDAQVTRRSDSSAGELLVAHGSGIPPIGVTSSEGTYFGQAATGSAAAGAEYAGLRAAIIGHSGWIAVGTMKPGAATPARRLVRYQLLGRLVAEFCDRSCLMLYLPADGRFAHCGADAVGLLREGRITELFSDEELNAPLYPVDAPDSEIAAAIAQARDRLPEFLAAFAARGRASEALFKARFTFPDDTGGAEMIWLSLTEVTPYELIGVIENSPISPRLPRKGASARVSIGAVVDWAYKDARGEMTGPFLERLLVARRTE